MTRRNRPSRWSFKTRKWRGEKPTDCRGKIRPMFNRYVWSFLPKGMRLEDKEPNMGDPREY